MIWRGVHTAWPRGPKSHPAEAKIEIFQGKRVRGREAREPAGGRPGGGGQGRAPRGGEPGTPAEVPKKLKSLKTFCFSRFYEKFGSEGHPILG